VISDVDYIAKLDAVMPNELRALASRLGIQPEDVAGKVRSVTYRATKRVSCCS
jgi:hypothetical protein